MTNDPLIFQKLRRELQVIHSQQRRVTLVQVLFILSGCLLLVVALTMHAESYCALIVSAPLSADRVQCEQDGRPATHNAVRPARQKVPADDGGTLRPAGYFPATIVAPTEIAQR